MARDSAKKSDVVLSISQATISPQLLEILKCFKLNNVKFHVFIMAKNDNPLLESIKALNVSYQILPEISKFGIGKHFALIIRYLLMNHPKTFITSGQYATLSSMPAAFLFRIKNRIYIRHHSNFHHKYDMRFGLSLDRLMNYCATQIVAVSNVVRSILVQKEFVPESKVIVIHNGVDLKRFHHKDRVVNANKHVFKIGVISRLTEWKGVEYTADSFKEFNSRYPNSFLHIIGASSDSLPKIQSILLSVPKNNYQIESLNLDIPEFLRSVDVLVHVPLEPDDEAFGIVYIETLAAGTPGIFTISGVLNELNNPERYFSVVPPRDSNAIYQKLEEIYFHKSVYDQVPHEWLNQFSLENQGFAYLKLLEL